MTDQSIFGSNVDNQTTEPASDPFKDWVGPGKKYASVEEMARANIYAQEHISSLEKTKSELLEDLTKRNSLAQLVDKLSTTVNTSQTTSPVATPAQDRTVDKVQAADLESLIAEKIQSVFSNKEKQENASSVAKTLSAKFGDKAEEMYRVKAAELGLTIQMLNDLSMTSPKAVLAYFGSDLTSTLNPTTTHAKVSTEAFSSASTSNGDPKPGTYAYYQKIRRENPSAYYSPKTQIEMHDQAVKLGQDFYK